MNARVAVVLTFAVVGASWAAVLVRLADAPAVAVAFWRLALSVLLLALPALILSGQWRDMSRAVRSDWGWMALAGACLALHFVAWFQSLAYTSVASSTVLVSLHPLMVGALSALVLRESPHRLEWIGIAAAVGGGMVVGWGDFGHGRAPLLGDALAAGGGAALALYLVCGRRVRPRLMIWSYVTIVYAVATALAGALAVATAVPLRGYPPRTWWLFVALVAGPMALGHTGFNWALRYVRAYVVSVLQLLEPVIATLLAVLVLGRAETPTWNTLAGGVAILGGVWCALWARGRVRSVQPEVA